MVVLSRWLLYLLSLVLLASCFDRFSAVKGQEDNEGNSCTICLDGTNNITRPDYLIELPGFPPVTCQTATFLASAISDTSAECQQARLLASPLCGCRLLEASPCILCPGASNTSSSLIVSIDDLGFEQSAIEVVPSLSSLLFDDQVAEPTCEMVQALLLNHDKDSDVCQSSRSEALSVCGCDKSNTTEPSQGSGAGEAPKCSLCPSGEPISFPGKEIPGFFAPTCSILASITSDLPRDSADCANVRQLGYYCGCPAPPPTCSLCTDGRPIPKPDALVETLILPGNFTPTCAVFEGLSANFPCTVAQGAAIAYCGCPPLEEESCILCPGGIPPERYVENLPFDDLPLQCGFLEAVQVGAPVKSLTCFFYEQIAHTCGCRDSVRTYGGADTIFRQIVLSWVPRLSALLSLVGSSLIIREARKTPHTMYQQLMITISASDVISSIAWFMSTWAISPEGIDAAVWGANGNFATCKLQGLLLIWSSTSHWLNVSLSLYYKLVIINGWRERQFTRLIRAVLVGLPLFASSTTSILCYRYIAFSGVGCNFLPFPKETKALPFYAFIAIPLIFSLVVVTILTLWISWKFSQQMQVADKWRLSGRRRDTLRDSSETVGTRLSLWAAGVTRNSLEGSVLRQSIFYLLAFLSAAPVVLITTILLSYFIVNYWLTLLSVIVVPLQGFTNALIYFRPRVFQWCSTTSKKIKHRAAQQKARLKTSSDGHEDLTETNHTATYRGSQAQPASGDGQIISSGVNRVTVDFNSNCDLADDANASDDEQREHLEFFRSHLHGPIASEEDEMSMDFAELDRERENENEHEESILVGSLVLPSFRGSSRWAVGNWEPEVSDYVCEQDDVICGEHE